MPPRNPNEQTLKDALKDYFNLFQLNNRLHNARIQNHWAALMGANIAEQTQKVWVKNGVLYVTLKSATLKQELSFAKSKIVQRINEKLGEDHIKDVVFWL